MSEPDTRSYSERYAPPQAPPPPPPAPESRDGRFIAIIGLGLLVAAIAAAWVLRGGTAAPSASTATVTPTATLSTGPAARTPEADDLALQGFWALLVDPKLSYHVETKGGGTIGSEAYTFSESLDVSGDDWGGTERAHGLGVAGVTSIVALDTEVWIKFPDGWHKNIEHDPYFRSRPFLDLDSQRDLMISGEVVNDGRTLYDLKSTTNYQPYPGRLIGFVSMGVQVDTLELDILVTGEGVPVQATVHILAGGLGPTGKPQIDAKATRAFSKVGATFTIKAPKS